LRRRQQGGKKRTPNKILKHRLKRLKKQPLGRLARTCQQGCRWRVQVVCSKTVDMDTRRHTAGKLKGRQERAGLRRIPCPWSG
jgi:hypothetical protein